MIEGQEGVSWEQWVALARAAEDGGPRRALPLRPLPLDRPRRPGRLARRLGDARRARRGAPTRIRLGTMVSPVTFRRVPVLAKMVTTVDHISNGRVELGLGAGWFEAEHEAYGFAFPPPRERLDELDRQLAEIMRHWTDADGRSGRSRCSSRGRRSSSAARAKPRTVRAAVALRRRVQHGLADGRRGARAQADRRRRRTRSRPRAAPLLDDDRLRRRPRRTPSCESASPRSRRSPAATRRRSPAPSTQVAEHAPRLRGRRASSA